MKDFAPENTTGYRCILVAIDNFSKYVWTVLLNNKNAQTIKDSFENNLITSERSPNLIETDDGKEFVKKIFTDLLNKNNIKNYSRYTSLGVVFAESFNRTIRDLLKRSVFEKRDASWIDVLPVIAIQNSKRIHSSTKLTPIEDSLRKNEGLAHKKFLDKRKN